MIGLSNLDEVCNQLLQSYGTRQVHEALWGQAWASE